MSYGKLDYDPLLDAHKCEECGRWYRALARHITRHHKITTREYKIKWGINIKEPLFGREVLEKLSKAAHLQGVSRNLSTNYRFKPGDNTVQSYKRSEQTKRRLRTLRLGKRKLKMKIKKKVI